MTGPGIRYPWDAPPAEGEAIQIAEGVLWLRLPLPMVLDHVNIYALDEGAAQVARVTDTRAEVARMIGPPGEKKKGGGAAAEVRRVDGAQSFFLRDLASFW